MYGVIKDKRWSQIVRRDKAADEQFWYSIKTSRIYCRPSCPSRTPNPKNVQIHNTLDEAKSTGFRPCGRCNPNANSIDIQHRVMVGMICKLIEQNIEELTLNDLAAIANLSVSHFHRLFKSITGVTPKNYTKAIRAERLRSGLETGNSVTRSLYDAGFNSTGRLYDAANNLLGMTPSHYRSGGINEEIRFAVGVSTLGSILVASSKKGVVSILLGDDAEELVRNLQDRFYNALIIGADQEYEKLIAHVVGFLETPSIGHNLSLDIRGTSFQQRVWQALQKIPPGKTVSYEEIARIVGSPKSILAVTSACAANNIAVAIPCHRVVKSNGLFWGYTWGIERKQKLLEREQVK